MGANPGRQPSGLCGMGANPGCQLSRLCTRSLTHVRLLPALYQPSQFEHLVVSEEMLGEAPALTRTLISLPNLQPSCAV